MVYFNGCVCFVWVNIGQK